MSQNIKDEVLGDGRSQFEALAAASQDASRDVMMRRLYRLHRLHVGAPLGERDDNIPTTRGDLRELYSAILDGKVARPEWAANLLQ